jgi:hypothetical protein
MAMIPQVKQLTDGSDILKMEEQKLHQFSISEYLLQISLLEMGCWFMVMMLKPNKNPHTWEDSCFVSPQESTTAALSSESNVICVFGFFNIKAVFIITPEG